MAAAAAVSCSLMSRGCLNARAVSAQSAVVSTSSSGNNLLAWDPLRQAMPGSRSAYLSSFSPSIALSRKFTQPQRSSRLGLAVPRASSKDEEELEKVGKIDSESNVGESLETSTNGWSQFVSSAAKPALVAMMVAILLAQPGEDAFAASSGGRVGGKVFSKPSAPSRSYSGGGGGGGGGGGRGYSGGGLYAPPLYGSPYGFSPFGYSPFYGGGYGGGGFFMGPPLFFGGGGTIFLALFAFATVRAVVGFLRDRFRGDDEDRFDE